MVLLTIPESARILGVGTEACYAMARTGAIPTVRVGVAVRVPVAALADRLGVSPEELLQLGEEVVAPAGLLSVAEVSLLYRVSRSTVTRAVARGEIPGRRVGGRFYIPLSAIATSLDLTDGELGAAVDEIRAQATNVDRTRDRGAEPPGSGVTSE